ncbi:transporter substrate-binding domain-containing protein [Rheinheimera texasensis]|uniref:substrate-binding periplasmic protein n=1 Tax=Rheinheimera texasensis TaxID=306205 RepID=UPI0032B0F4C0
MKSISFLCLIPLLLFISSCGPKTPAPVSSAQPEATPAVASTVAEPAKPTVTCQLKLGFEAWEPYQYTSLDNKPAGLDIELVQAIAGQMGCEIAAQQGTWMDLIAALKSGGVDLLLGASVTPARQEYAYFSDPYRQEQFVLFVRSEDVAGYPQNTLADFIGSGKKVGIISEYYYGAEFAELFKQDALKQQFVEASLGELNLARLLDEDIDGMLEDSFVGHAMLRRKGLDKQIGAHSISMGNTDVFVMFSKATVKPEQVSSFNQALAAIKADGRYNAIVQRYIH